MMRSKNSIVQISNSLLAIGSVTWPTNGKLYRDHEYGFNQKYSKSTSKPGALGGFKKKMIEVFQNA